MVRVEKTIEIERPLRMVYDQWTQFEEFPRFMEGVEEVRQLDDRTLRWKARIAGKTEEWEAEIVHQVPDQVNSLSLELINHHKSGNRSDEQPSSPERAAPSSLETWVGRTGTEDRNRRLAIGFREARCRDAHVDRFGLGGPGRGLIVSLMANTHSLAAGQGRHPFARA